MKPKHLQTAIVVLSLLVIGTQPAPGTITLSNLGWSVPEVGDWDSATLTGTIKQNLGEGIEIVSDGVTLDGGRYPEGYTVTGSGTGNGVYLSGRTNVTIQNLKVQGFVYGISVDNSHDITVTGNDASKNDHGIGLGYSSDSTVSYNTASNSSSGGWMHGIHLGHSDHITVNDNFANSNDGQGIYVQDSNDNILTGNTTSSNTGQGILLYNSDRNELIDNTASLNNDTGIGLNDSNDNTVSGNTVSNNPNHGIYVGLYSSGNKVIDNVANSNNSGIRVQSYSSYTIVTGNVINGNSAGICMRSYTHHNEVTNNEVLDNNTYGVQISESSNNQISENNLSGNETAIWAGGPRSHSNSYLNNDLSKSKSWSLWIGDNSEFEQYGNDFTNSANGIGLSNMEGASLSNVDLSAVAGGIGVLLSDVKNSSFSDIIISGGEYGILIQTTSTGNTFLNNTVYDNTYGIYIIYNSSDNVIYNNKFINNSTQAYVGSDSSSIFNLDKPIGGNYWSDWTSPDVDGDGFVDYPYVFINGQDNLPWADPDGWMCRDAQEMMMELADQVTSLNLQNGINNSLDAKLAAALQALENINENNDAAAINTLEAFINAVQAQSDSKIPQADADALIAKAQKIIDCLKRL